MKAKQITIISGKGGTGKTTITACFTKIAKNFITADCDVDAADMHLLLNPIVKEKFLFYSGKNYSIHHNKCISCGKCQEICRFDAISNDYNIDHIACESCGACFFVCPTQAITEEQNLAGEYYISQFNNNKNMLIHANLYIGEDNSGKLVSEVRKKARKLAEDSNSEYIIIDGPPGIGCPVNAAIVGTDLAVIVTEPTLSGIHDLERILAVAKHFNIPSKVIINKYDINLKNTKEIEKICQRNNSELLGKIKYDKLVVKSLIEGKTIIETHPNHEISNQLKTIWEKIK
ncbi:MAG: P-loop NTPase [Candidatus Margulisbacteria bacterium]|nr:P-loop NTPase [Candidatus Margulisiibacteriota bacterium]